ncbi:MAG TPA: hypothetical protein VNI20_05880 [Fimbriimonadaceae bacterium]|nr:hypothetical protein [Fimbriimonadaceae bacterium]
MRLLSVLSLVVAGFGLLAVIGSTVAMSKFAAKAELVQLVKPYDSAMAQLLGEAGTPIGSPQKIILDDRSAVIEGRGQDGAVLVDEDKLKASGRYPVQLKTLDYVGGLVRGVGGVAFIVGAAVWLLLLRRRRLGKEGGSPSNCAYS